MAAKSISPAMRTSSFSRGLTIAPGPPPDPPELANLQHWLDLTDPTQVFSDTAGTIQALNGEKVESIRNKGTSTGHPILDFTLNTLTLTTNAINGHQVISAGVGNNVLVSPSDPEVGGASGLTMAAVGRVRDLTTTFFDWEWGSDLTLLGVTSGWLVRPVGLLTINSGKPIVLDEWVWVYGSFAAGDNNVRASGASEVLDTGAYTQRTGSEAITVFIENADMAECLVYNIDFNPTQRTALTSYFDEKYTTLPFVN